MIHALIDGDWIIYAAGFAGQKNELVCPDMFGKRVFRTKTEIIKAAEAECGGEFGLPIYFRYILDEDSHFFHSAKNMIESSCNKIEKKWGEDVVARVFIDGDGNFRNQIATIRPYKGQRSVHAKPLKYNDIRQYLLDNKAAILVHDEETDDAIACEQTKLRSAGEKSVIISVDKDFLQVPGWHMNPKKGYKNVGHMEARVRLYRQCITGDTVDNIGGAYKYGPGAAKRIIKSGMSELEMWERVLAAYADSIDAHGNHYGGLTGEQAALENMRLVFLRREEGQLWVPPV